MAVACPPRPPSRCLPRTLPLELQPDAALTGREATFYPGSWRVPPSRATTAFHQPTIIPLLRLERLPLRARPEFSQFISCLTQTNRPPSTVYDELPSAPEVSRQAAAMADQSVFRITKVGRSSLVPLCHRGVEALTMMPFPTTGAERPSKEFGSM